MSKLGNIFIGFTLGVASTLGLGYLMEKYENSNNNNSDEEYIKEAASAENSSSSNKHQIENTNDEQSNTLPIIKN